MTQTVEQIERRGKEATLASEPTRLSALRFFFRYPIFLLVFGPPQFKPALVGVDTSRAHFDSWNVFQVGWLSVIAVRAAVRLLRAKPILIPRRIRSILQLPLLLGILFLISVAYSPGRVVSIEYVLLYFFNLICVVEFVTDAYQHPPDWMQCIFQIRLVSICLTALVLLTLLVSPSLVMNVQAGFGFRILGGSVANMALYPEIISIVSAYTFLYSLESRMQAAILFFAGIAGTLFTKTRGVEISLLVILALIAMGRARLNKRFALLAIAASMSLLLVAGVTIATIGSGNLWRTFNRGQDLRDIATASGRTGVWADQIAYCFTHPQGMGYIAGVRAFHRRDFSGNLHAALTNMGGTDNSYMEVLTDAGWLALALYFAYLAKALSLVWRLAKNRSSRLQPRIDIPINHPARCALLLLCFCLAEGLESSMYVIPMFGSFYTQNVLLAMIFGIAANDSSAMRPRMWRMAR